MVANADKKRYQPGTGIEPSDKGIQDYVLSLPQPSAQAPVTNETHLCYTQRRKGLKGYGTSLVKKGKEPLPAVYAMVRDQPKQFLKRLGFLYLNQKKRFLRTP